MFLIVIAYLVSMHLTALVLITALILTRINSSRVHLDYMPHRTTFKIPFLTHSALSTTLAAWKAPKWACLGLWCFFHATCIHIPLLLLLPMLTCTHAFNGGTFASSFCFTCKAFVMQTPWSMLLLFDDIDAIHCKQKRGEAGRLHAEMGWTVGKASFKSPFLAYLPHGPSFQWRPSCMFQNATFSVFGCADHAFKSH